MTATPNQAQRTGLGVTAPASTTAFPPSSQVPRRSGVSLSLRSLGPRCMRTLIASFGAVLAFCMTLSPFTLAGDFVNRRYPHLRERLKRGQEIVEKLSALTPQQVDAFDVKLFREEIVEFVGSGAPPGGTNDLMLEEGYYLRVVNPQNRDLRPHSALWEVHVKGKIMQVLPRNRIIVLQVNEKDWHVLQTM